MKIDLEYSGSKQIEIFVPAGETFSVNGVKLRCEINEEGFNDDKCEGCYFNEPECCCLNISELICFDCGDIRGDENAVIFREVKDED